jgi:MFS family permease
MLPGLGYGAVSLSTGLHRRLLTGVAVFAGGLVPLLFAGGLPELTVLLLISGAMMAPATITLMEVIQRIVPAPALTEAVSWAGSGTVLGMTAGGLLGGWGAQHLPVSDIYAIPVACGALALTMVGLGYRGVIRALS